MGAIGEARNGSPAGARLLAGSSTSETLAEHVARLGPLPPLDRHGDLVGVLDRAGLLGRGGAGFPVGRKWRSVSERSRGDAVVVVNGAEGEPLSAKDRTLMTLRPHLVLDGAMLAAAAVGASRVLVYVGTEHSAAIRSIARALGERTVEERRRTSLALVEAPRGYVAGESSAVVHYLDSGDARPLSVPPRPFERGVDGKPTLVQNAETLAHVALLARFGADWYRSAGRGTTPGTALVTLSVRGGGRGAHGRLAVREIEYGTTVGELATGSGLVADEASAVLLGGYFGGWATIEEAWRLPLDPAAMAAAGFGFGCGVVSFLAAGSCGVAATARIMRYMAGSSAGQCGPCVYGLNAIAGAADRLALGRAERTDLERVAVWSDQLEGRGACHHPDGAVGLLRSARRVFADDFTAHQRSGHCLSRGLPAEAA